MANADERRVLTGPARDQQEAVKIVRHLTGLLIKKIQQSRDTYPCRQACVLDESARRMVDGLATDPTKEDAA